MAIGANAVSLTILIFYHSTISIVSVDINQKDKCEKNYILASILVFMWYIYWFLPIYGIYGKTEIYRNGSAA